MKYDTTEESEVEYKDFVRKVDRLMNGNTEFCVEGKEVGWSNACGETEVSYNSGRDLMYDLAVDLHGEFTAEVTDLGEGSFEIYLKHHDSRGEIHTFHPK